MIITKSVSRFARNLLDCIGWVRKLKERDPPIQVFFEQEHLNTLDTTSNIILFVLAMVAGEESHTADSFSWTMTGCHWWQCTGNIDLITW